MFVSKNQKLENERWAILNKIKYCLYNIYKVFQICLKIIHLKHRKKDLDVAYAEGTSIQLDIFWGVAVQISQHFIMSTLHPCRVNDFIVNSVFFSFHFEDMFIFICVWVLNGTYYV